MTNNFQNQENNLGTHDRTDSAKRPRTRMAGARSGSSSSYRSGSNSNSYDRSVIRDEKSSGYPQPRRNDDGRGNNSSSERPSNQRSSYGSNSYGDNNRSSYGQSSSRSTNGGNSRGGSYGGSRNEGGYGNRQSGGYGSSRSEGAYGNRQSGGYGSSRSEGAYSNRQSGGYGSSRSEGGYGNRQSGGYGGSRSEGGYGNRQSGGYGGSRSEGGYGNRQSGGYGGSRSEGGYGNRQSGGYGGSRSAGGYGNRQSGGYGGSRSAGGYGNRQSGGYGSASRSEGGYNKRPSSGGYGGASRNEGGYSSRPAAPRQRTDDYDPNNKYSQRKQIEYKKAFIDYTKPMRLNKFLANAGICSRREADEFIQAGVVTINDEIVTELGTKIVPATDKVLFHDQLVKTEKKVYILLNKPKDCVTTVEDTHARMTVLDLVRGACEERVYPVGRLDRNTTGVLLITNDGDLTSKLTHPKYDKKKIYHAVLDKDITDEDMEKISGGIVLEDGEIKADAISFVKEDDRRQVGIEIHSGKNRIVRRIFDSIGYHVVRLDRVYFAGLTKKNLPRGRWRYLSELELNMLKMGSND